MDELRLLFELFITFSRISLFNFGGGFVMITLIQGEIVPKWLSLTEFNNVIAISQMTPGAIAINTGTFVGYKIAGIKGALVASLAIPIPSFFIVLILSPILLKYKDHGMNKMIFYGIRPVVVGLIINAAITVSTTPFYVDNIYRLNNLFKQMKMIGNLNIGSISIFIISLVLIVKYKLNPIIVILISGLLGIVTFSIIPTIF